MRIRHIHFHIHVYVFKRDVHSVLCNQSLFVCNVLFVGLFGRSLSAYVGLLYIWKKTWAFHIYIFHIHVNVFTRGVRLVLCNQSFFVTHMGWLRLVSSFKLQVSFAKEPYKRDDILQKWPMILRSLLIVAPPYVFVVCSLYVVLRNQSLLVYHLLFVGLFCRSLFILIGLFHRSLFV